MDVGVGGNTVSAPVRSSLFRPEDSGLRGEVEDGVPLTLMPSSKLALAWLALWENCRL